MLRPVPQVGSMGCAVSCVAAISGRSYPRALKLFDEPARHTGAGFGKRRVQAALRAAGHEYALARFHAVGRAGRLAQVPDRGVLFVRAYPGDRYGHYLVRDGHDSWVDSADEVLGSKTKKSVSKGAVDEWEPQRTGQRHRQLPRSYVPEGMYLRPREL